MPRRGTSFLRLGQANEFTLAEEVSRMNRGKEREVSCGCGTNHTTSPLLLRLLAARGGSV